ncbi:restriction endonuclease subunit S [Streptomyces sp. NPDC044571]|uniref:restriction endonuclease subunit S n=1 Tax=Streptomyces sp. NPDC044571 TaxID=3155371 RepID=UPI0033DF8D6E
MSAARADQWLSLAISDIAVFGSGDLISVARLSTRSGSNPVPVYGGNGIAGYTSSAMIGQPTVILGRVGQKCGVVYLNDGPAWITDNALYARQFKRPLNVRFLALALEAARLNDVKNKNDLPLITQSILNDVKIAWPDSLEEQRAVAEALGDVEALIVELERVIAKRQAIKKGMLQRFFDRGTRAPVGENGAREVRKEQQLGNLLLRPPRYGINAAAVPLTAATPTYIRITDIDDSGRFSPKVGVDHPKSANYHLNQGELVFARTGASVGKSYLCDPHDGELVYAGFLINIAPNPQVLNPAYLALFAQTKQYWDWVASTSVRSGQPGINGRELAQLPIFAPEIEEQNVIVSTVSDIDAEIAALGRRLGKARLIKTGMMQELLTGRTRLPVQGEGGE